jgi:hypothetical protein
MHRELKTISLYIDVLMGKSVVLVNPLRQFRMLIARKYQIKNIINRRKNKF